MKLVVAYIQPHKLNDVKKALFKADVHKIVCNKCVRLRRTARLRRKLQRDQVRGQSA